MYYKIYNNTAILDVISQPSYFKTNRVGCQVACDRTSAEGLLSSDGSRVWYIIEWSKDQRKGEAHLAEITQLEYEQIYDAIKAVKDDGLGEGEQEDVAITVSDLTLKAIHDRKIDLVNKSCSEKIIEGISLVLSDKKEYHFDLTIEDQINLLSIQSLIDSGAEYIPYHAKGKEAILYSSTDMRAILSAVQKHRLYHITYVNALKSYIHSLTDLNELAEVYYGMSIPEEYQTEALKSLLK